MPIYPNGVVEDVYWTFSYSPVVYDESKGEGILVTCTEARKAVTNLKQTRESEYKLRNMILKAPVGVCVLDARTLVAEITNDRFIEVAGRPYDAIVGKMYWDAFAESKPY